MKYYAKITAKNKIENATRLLMNRGASLEDILVDDGNNQKQEGSNYSCLKSEVIRSHEPVTFDSITSLGKNSREIFKELEFFNNNCIRVYIADLDFTYDESVDPMLALDKIFEKLAALEKQNVKEAQKLGIDRYLNENSNNNYGRPKLPYPDNWEENYVAWRNGDITANEFMKRTGLKKGTFYNMIKEYKVENQDRVSKRA